MTDVITLDVEDSSEQSIDSNNLILPEDKNIQKNDTDSVVNDKNIIVSEGENYEPEAYIGELAVNSLSADENKVANPTVSVLNPNLKENESDNKALIINEDSFNEHQSPSNESQKITDDQKDNVSNKNNKELNIEEEEEEEKEKYKIVTRTKLYSGILMKKSRWMRKWRERELCLYSMENGRYVLETYVHKREEIKEQNMDQGTDSEDKEIEKEIYKLRNNDRPLRRATATIELFAELIESQVEMISFRVAKCDSGFVLSVWEMNDGQRKKEFQFRMKEKKDRDQWFNAIMSIGGYQSKNETLMKDTLNILLMTLRKNENLRCLSICDNKNGKTMHYSSAAEKAIAVFDECTERLNDDKIDLEEILEIQQKLKDIAQKRNDWKSVKDDDTHINGKIIEEEINQ